jgi:hypothetical protein
MKTLKMGARLVIGATLGGLAALNVNAQSVLIGSVYKASTSDAVSEAWYVNTMFDVARGDIGTGGVYGEVYGSKIRTYTTITAGDYGPDVSASDALGGTSSITLSGWNYVVAKYNYKDFVWYLNGENFTIPTTGVDLGWNSPLTSWEAFSTHVATETPPTQGRFSETNNVPDGGATGGLLALGIAGLASLRRVGFKTKGQ